MADTSFPNYALKSNPFGPLDIMIDMMEVYGKTERVCNFYVLWSIYPPVAGLPLEYTGIAIYI